MRISEILHESPQKDLDRIRYAQRSIGKIAEYLRQKNEDVPLKDCDFYKVNTQSDTLWVFPFVDAGVPYQNAFFAIGYRHKRSKDIIGNPTAYVTTATLDGKTIILLVMLLHSDPSDETDIAFKMNYSVMTHEFIHVMDYRRGYLAHKEKQNRSEVPKTSHDDPESYYNSPIEFNAYYQQGVANILNLIGRKYISSQLSIDNFRSQVLSSFSVFYTTFKIEFDNYWLKHLTENTQRRFKKRLFKLYKMIENEFPNMAAIIDMEHEQAEINKKLEGH